MGIVFLLYEISVSGILYNRRTCIMLSCNKVAFVQFAGRRRLVTVWDILTFGLAVNFFLGGKGGAKCPERLQE